jgi:FkbM family methyltransferase
VALSAPVIGQSDGNREETGLNPTTHIPDAPAWVRMAAAIVPRLPAARYRIIAKLCAKPREAFLMRLPEKLGGYSYFCDLGDIMSREICFTGRFEPQETALFRALLRPGMTFVDVGGNWGYFTLLAAHLVGSGGRVIAFEPDPRLHRLLRDNIARNGLIRVTALEIAAAAEAGTLTMAGYEEGSDNYGLSRVVAPKTNGDNGPALRTFMVPAKPIDAVLDELALDQVDLLKMDIEGAEEFALRGMREGLARHRYRRIILELHPALLLEHGRTAQDAFDLVRQAGYRAWRIDHSPETMRRVAYLDEPSVRELLRPVEAAGALDAWPHLLWLAPGVELEV